MTEPSFVHCYLDGSVRAKEWHKNGRYHRTDGPAAIMFHENGKTRIEEWAINGVLHRVVFPAIMSYDQSGNLIGYDYYNQHFKITSEVSEYLTENDLSDPLNIPLEHRIIMKMKFW